MRISDWSSDVCSSDLVVTTGERSVRLFRSRAERIEFTESSNFGNYRRVLAWLGCHAVDFVEREGQLICFLRQFTSLRRAFDQLRTSIEPFNTVFAVPRQQRSACLVPAAEIVGAPCRERW